MQQDVKIQPMQQMKLHIMKMNQEGSSTRTQGNNVADVAEEASPIRSSLF